MIIVSSDCMVIRIVLGWVIVVSLGLYGCCGGDKTYFRGTVIDRKISHPQEAIICVRVVHRRHM